MQLTNNIGYLIQHLAFTLSRQNEQILQERLGLGFSQFKILMLLQSNPSVQQRDIADGLGQTEASVSRQIKLMIRRGLLSSQVSPNNRRQHITTPTTKGLRLTEEAMHILNNYHAPMFERFNDKQREQLLQMLQIMHECACSSGKTGACQHPYSSN